MTKQEFPAMQFYPESWLSGRATRLMTAEQRGAYIDLLAHAWMGHPACTVPDDDAALAVLAGVPLPRWRKIGAKVKEQFQPIEGYTNPSNLLRNAKQFDVYLAMQKLRERRASSGQQGGRPKANLKQTESNTEAKAILDDKQTESNAKANPAPLSLALALALKEELPPTSATLLGDGVEAVDLIFDAAKEVAPGLALDEVTIALWLRDIQPDPWQIAAVLCEVGPKARGAGLVRLALLERQRDGWPLSSAEAREFVEYSRHKARKETA